MFNAKVYVNLKKSVFDPQGDTVLHALHSMDYKNAKSMRVGKYFEMEIDTDDHGKAEEEVRKICDTVLVNPVMEDYRMEIEG